MPAHFDQINATFEAFAEAWKTNDAETLSGFFVEDGTLINPFGHRADGRAAVAALYTQFFAGMLRGTLTSVNLASVRAVESNHAFADGEQTVTAPDGSVVLAVHIAALFRRDGDAWRFADARPYALLTPPA